MAFMGETVDVGVAELLSVLARRQHRGRLSISADGDETQIYLDAGKVILVNSSLRGLRLGQILLRLRLLEPERLDAAVREQDSNGRGRPLGQILLERGWITTDGLARAAEEQCIEAISTVMTSSHGTFMFCRDSAPPVGRGLVTLNTDGIVLEASRRADELLSLREMLPPETARLTPSPAHRIAAATLNPAERRLLELLESGVATLPALEAMFEGEKVNLWRAVVTLLDRGAIESSDRAAARQRGSDRARQDAPAPRTLGDIVALGAMGNGADVRPIPTLAEIRAGHPADDAEVEAITRVAREVVAEFNAGEVLRGFGHFSDHYFRRGGPITDDEFAALRRPAVPLPLEHQESFDDLRAVRRLPDDRLTAIRRTRSASAGEDIKVLVFAEIDGRWQIDAVVETPGQTTGLTAFLRDPSPSVTLSR